MLESVAAVSKSDAWAVGSLEPSRGGRGVMPTTGQEPGRNLGCSGLLAGRRYDRRELHALG